MALVSDSCHEAVVSDSCHEALVLDSCREDVVVKMMAVLSLLFSIEVCSF